MNKYWKPWLIAAIIFPVITSTGCKKDTGEDNDGELITTVILRFNEAGTSNIVSATFRDTDGDGGNPPTLFEPIVLKTGKVYNASIQLLNESVSPPENITDEVEDEADEHQFYYLPSGVAITVRNLNTDNAGRPLGTAGEWVTAGPGTGTVRVVLKHKPNGQKGPSDDVSIGETDIDLNFSARVE